MSLYLKYRPKDFSSLVGQDFVRDTLRNAILKDKLVWAYLFTGPRGTGKTSSARIFALSLNCQNPQDGNPCGQCDICKSFAGGQLVDIVEIDAASHTSVDNVREIIEKAQFTPNRAKYKVYIIDEVHMLSKGAFNALLKILEEPPSHVKFILATTEIQKVPETILSRCQRYDFRSIDNESVKKRLEFIASEESVSVDAPSLEYIVENAQGWLRNAINLFEQLIHNGKIDFQELVQNLGVTQKEKLVSFYQKLLQKDTSIIDDFESIVSSGKNLKLFFKDLLFFIKNTIVQDLKSGKSIASGVSILEVLDETYGKTKYALDDGITFLTGILKIISGAEKIVPEKVQKAVTPTIQKTVQVKEEISHDDVLDMFSSPQTPSPAPANLWGAFDVDRFSQVLKWLQVPASILTWLRESQIGQDENTLKIQPKNKFSKMALEKPENVAFIQKWLQEMWFEAMSIEFIS